MELAGTVPRLYRSSRSCSILVNVVAIVLAAEKPRCHHFCSRNSRRVFSDGVYRELLSLWSPAVTLVLPEPPLVQPLLGSLEYELLRLLQKWLAAEVLIVGVLELRRKRLHETFGLWNCVLR
ncbi:uncharacterized protein DS421_3g95880 [Arachis hypogaea]|nr:uncharacterized protein DS421_3g95880 [Arachis hypogaea]